MMQRVKLIKYMKRGSLILVQFRPLNVQSNQFWFHSLISFWYGLNQVHQNCGRFLHNFAQNTSLRILFVYYICEPIAKNRSKLARFAMRKK
jgi:hypothetical protein